MKIAAILDDLTLSQESFYMIKNFNILSSNMNNQAYCFYNNLASVCVKPLFATMGIYHAHHFNDGKIIATNINNVKTLLNISSKCDKYFYVWDIEWIRKGMHFFDNVKVMRDPSIQLLARSESHASIIENYCNKPVSSILDDWNYKQLERL